MSVLCGLESNERNSPGKNCFLTPSFPKVPLAFPRWGLSHHRQKEEGGQKPTRSHIPWRGERNKWFQSSLPRKHPAAQLARAWNILRCKPQGHAVYNQGHLHVLHRGFSPPPMQSGTLQTMPVRLVKSSQRWWDLQVNALERAGYHCCRNFHHVW